ncbi:MAG: YifB family Mg chelatase-like AAA ATPase, partial [Gemmatimonadaceae bacterium]
VSGCQARRSDATATVTCRQVVSMLAAVKSAALMGIEAYDIIVEVDAAAGLPQWTMVGLPLGAVKESRERVGAALVNSGFKMPPRRITVNLDPADVRKEGTAFDLPIAIGILVATGQLDPLVIKGRLFVGELGLDGTIRGIRGALSIARRAEACKSIDELVLPLANLAEAGRVSSLRLSAQSDFRALADELRCGTLSISVARPQVAAPSTDSLDFADVVGQQSAKRALEVAAAGGHNVMMIGPPGAGKTMLARRLPGILPELSEAESLEVIAIHSVAGTLTSQALASGARPFRSPHHSISSAGLIGGGGTPRPGEVSLAHNGVLFLDEMLEFPRSVLEGLRQPMEDGKVVISRATMSVPFPARFTLVGATNPCPCGRLGDPTGKCTCSPSDVERYSSRLSGPLNDRIDMHVAVGAVPLSDLSSCASGESSSVVRTRVDAARSRQASRFGRLRGIECNAHSPGRWIDSHGNIETAARTLLQKAAGSLSLSARGYHRVLKVARTIADIDEDETVTERHVAEALRYRPAGRT